MSTEEKVYCGTCNHRHSSDNGHATCTHLENRKDTYMWAKDVYSSCRSLNENNDCDKWERRVGFWEHLINLYRRVRS